MSSFKELNLITPILDALNAAGYTHPTSIQEQAIPLILANKDLIGCAQTGTGKTAAFAIPILQILHSNKRQSKDSRKIRALILAPTRELAIQVGENFGKYGKHTGVTYTVVYGGVSQYAQVTSLRKGPDILIATPGRLKDLMDQGHIDLSAIELFILDEADRMLDMGFIHDIKLILSILPSARQSLFFTATLSPEILKLSSSILVNPSRVEVSAASSAAETVSQSLYYVDKQKKKPLLMHLLLGDTIQDVLIFTRTKHGADALAEDLERSGIKADAIHGGKSQNARQRALSDFKSKKIRVLVATDVAARGIDIEKLSYVINYELPNEPETYIHRIGRTGRAGTSGEALSFCDKEEMLFLRQITKLVPKALSVVEDHPFSDKRKSSSVSAKSTFIGSNRGKKIESISSSSGKSLEKPRRRRISS